MASEITSWHFATKIQFFCFPPLLDNCFASVSVSCAVSIRNGTCRLTSERGDFNNLEFPNTIEGVITRRIDRLTPQQQLTLKSASVIGRIFAL